jgi:hypothetical protein
MKKLAAMLFLIVASVSVGAHAEGGCPPGQVPQQGQGWASCIPLPDNGVVPGSDFVGPTKEARWISVATDGVKGIIGQSDESKTNEEAVSTALSDCATQGGTDCKDLASVKNGCLSIATSSLGFGAGIGPTQQAANNDANGICQSGPDKNCRSIYARCVSPVLR